MTSIGTPYTTKATKIILLGAGELGKEFTIEAQRLGIEVIAIDRYANAPAMQVAHRSYVVEMLDGVALRGVIETEKPDFIVPEIEAIATSVLIELEQQGYCVIPTARAVQLTMNREGIRRLAAEQLQLRTTPYCFAATPDEYHQAVATIGLPCVVKPIMSSSGKGQSIVRIPEEVEQAWHAAQTLGRGRAEKIIVEAFIKFDYEITLLTIRHSAGTLFCEPIGHLQVHGDYRESWQPHPMPPSLLAKAQQMAKTITDALGGRGLFGVEFFVKDNEIYFNEISPRPHDTGMVTLISQDLSEFALHLRAIVGLPIPSLGQLGPAASYAILARGKSASLRYHQLDQALSFPQTKLYLFGKPNVNGERRVGVALALGNTIEDARKKAAQVAAAVQIELLS